MSTEVLTLLKKWRRFDFSVSQIGHICRSHLHPSEKRPKTFENILTRDDHPRTSGKKTLFNWNFPNRRTRCSSLVLTALTLTPFFMTDPLFLPQIWEFFGQTKLYSLCNRKNQHHQKIIYFVHQRGRNRRSKFHNQQYHDSLIITTNSNKNTTFALWILTFLLKKKTNNE